MRIRPVRPSALVDSIVAMICDGTVSRVAVDGAPSASPGDLAGSVVDGLRPRGRFALHVPASGFYRAASLRFERGRTDADAFYEDWLDAGALTREVLGPLGEGGTRRVLPSLWDAGLDRATRAAYVEVPPGGVVVVSGALLLGAGLDFDLTVHLGQSAAALARRVEPELRWTLPAYGRYADEVMPELVADVAVRVDDPARPALVEER